MGGFIGESNLAAEFVSSKVQVWSCCVRKLSDFADSQPQTAHAALARSLQFEWCHLQRVIPDIADFFALLCMVLNDLFYPTLLGGPVSEHEVRLFSLPARFGSLGISDPVVSALLAFLSSGEGASVLVDAIRGAGAVAFRVTTHLDQLARACYDVSERCEANVQSALTSVLKCLPSQACHTIKRAIDFQTSGQLTVLYLACHQFYLCYMLYGVMHMRNIGKY